MHQTPACSINMERERDEKAGGQTVVMALILCAAFRCNSASSSPQAGLTPQGSTRHASLVGCLLPPLLLLLTLSLHKMLATWHHPCVHLCMQACHEWFGHMQIMGGILLFVFKRINTSHKFCRLRRLSVSLKYWICPLTTRGMWTEGLQLTPIKCRSADS